MGILWSVPSIGITGCMLSETWDRKCTNIRLKKELENAKKETRYLQFAEILAYKMQRPEAATPQVCNNQSQETCPYSAPKAPSSRCQYAD